MRNDNTPLTEQIMNLISDLPYFDLANFTPFKKNRAYLKIIFSRAENKGKIIRLKKGFYVSAKFIEEIQKKNTFSDYIELIANKIYEPSYLSLDYVLYEYNILTEISKNFTSISLNKPIFLSNNLGNFFYHKIKKDLFLGFSVIKKGDFAILKATKAKALFDFLYFRKNNLIDRRAIEELRLNLNNIKPADWREFKKYLRIEKSKRMKEIFNNIKYGVKT